ncbi:sigma-70 family RNA polymerase sigma factor [Flavobacteriales bacterium]|nr:sigma-70 family RNA polymerase sigma factor [Flavobacteriales bacterium]
MVNKKLTEKAKEDLKIIELALATGDPRAYNNLMSKYRDPIFFMLYERVNNKELAKELTIEAFGKAFNKLDSYTPNFAFSTWLFSIAKNNCIDYLRKKKLPTYSIDDTIVKKEGLETAIEIPFQGDGPEKKMINKQRIQILRNIVEQLKPNYRKLVKLRYFKEYSYEEISTELDLPIGTVKAQLFRSREQLFKILSGKKDTF